MKKLSLFVAIALTLITGACSPSEEATRASLQADSLAQRRRATNFTTNQDTLTASVVTQSKAATYSSTSSDFIENFAFTVQIGAFTDPHNALNAQRLARERFAAYPVFNQYEPSLKLYRVSIGKFDARDDAAGFRREMAKLFPKEYSECWINTVAK
ncbi:MAG: SPOR domain-containing protein [Bacteroidota bacterium]